MQYIRLLGTKYEKFLTIFTIYPFLQYILFLQLLLISHKLMTFVAMFFSRPSQARKKNDSGKLDIKQGPTIQYHELPIIFVNANYNNTMFTITDHRGIIHV